MSVLDSLSVPVLVAPMAGGPSTPDLVIAASRAGSLGFLAGGVMGVDQLREDMARVQAEGGAFGVNLFCAQAEDVDQGALQQVVDDVAPEFRDYGLGEPAAPSPDLSNGWSEKFAAVVEARPTVFSCTFGIFSAEEFVILREAGIEAWVTVTNPEDAATAEAAGADAIVLQGPEAGGHRSTWTPVEDPDHRSLDELLSAVDVSIPIIAAGGIMTADDVARVLDLGASAASCGSAFLLAKEAGTSEQSRELIAQKHETVSTRAFSGRWARGVVTRFTRANESLPPLYPYLNPLLAPLRKAAATRGSSDFAYCLVGEGIDKISEGSVKQIIESLHSPG